MKKFISIVIGHNKAAKEHIEKYKLNHSTTILQAIVTTIIDSIMHKTVAQDDCYLVYRVVNKRTLGIKVYEVVSVYVPKEKRGQGYASKLYSLAPKPLMGVRINDNSKYRTVGNLCVIRENI